MSENIKWRRLDNSAKIFPLSTGKKYSTVFRLSAVMKEKVNPAILEKAVTITLEKYSSFKVKMKYGFFWYYLEENNKKPIIEEENNYPCKYIEPSKNNDYLFKVTYFDKKINIDIFHVLTDGGSGTVFFREIIYTYLEILHPTVFNSNERVTRKIDYNTEDSYLKNYMKNSKGNSSSKKAYILKGKKIKLGAISAIHEIINMPDLKQECDKFGATVTQYLTAVLIYSIYEANYKKYLEKKKTKNKDSENNTYNLDIDKKARYFKKPIKVCIPVNLKKYFPSKTMSNFFSYITLGADMNSLVSKANENQKNNEQRVIELKDFNIEQRNDLKQKMLIEEQFFTTILDFVKNDFKRKLTEEEILKTMSANVKLGTNFFIKAIPLELKKAIVRLSYLEIRKYTTVTFSNIGRIGIIGKYKDYIDEFLMLIAPEPVEKIKCSGCTFENKMSFTFTSILNDNNIEKTFYNFLKSRGIKVRIESNGVLDDISKEN